MKTYSDLLFIEAAEEFCKWLESAPLSKPEEYSLARKMVANLYASALMLPFPEPSDYEIPDVDEETRAKLVLRIKNLPFDIYWVAQDADIREEGQLVYGYLLDDLHDIYLDVKAGLLAYQHDRATAIWHLRFGFDTHWGQHAVSTLWALHGFDPYRRF